MIIKATKTVNEISKGAIGYASKLSDNSYKVIICREFIKNLPDGAIACYDCDEIKSWTITCNEHDLSIYEKSCLDRLNNEVG